MMKRILQANRRRVPVKYALIAGALAVVSIVGIETAGTALTSSYTGLNGKLAPAADGASAVVPTTATSK